MLTKWNKSRRALLASAFLVTATMAAAESDRQNSIGGASGTLVVDAKGKMVGRLLAPNTVQILATGQEGARYYSVKFKMPGFDTYTEIDQDEVVTAYYETKDCTGPIYYSDQADGKWKRNLTPSVYDVPARGISIGIIQSTVDAHFYSSIDVYYPYGNPKNNVSVQSKKIVGAMSVPTQCLPAEATPGNAFWQVRKIRIEGFKPPFGLK